MSDIKISVYNAGSLFTESERHQRRQEETLFKMLLADKRPDLVDKIVFHNPISNPFNDKSRVPTADEIFLGDTKQIQESSVIIANLDNQLDAGVFIEIGQAMGNAKKTFQDKLIVPVISDIRAETSHLYKGVESPWGINTYVIGAISINRLGRLGEYPLVHTTYAEAIDEAVSRAIEEYERRINTVEESAS